MKKKKKLPKAKELLCNVCGSPVIVPPEHAATARKAYCKTHSPAPRDKTF